MENDRARSTAVKVAVVGSGYVGTVVAASLGFIGHDVVGLETDKGRLASLRDARIPFHEPGAEELLAQAVSSGRLRFTDDAEDAVASSEVIFFCVGTPPTSGGHADVTDLAAAARSVARAMESPKILVTKSTVPVGSGEWLRVTIEDAMHPARAEHVPFSVVSNPEFLRQGSAVRDFLHPERVVLGSHDRDAIERLVAVYRPVLEQTFVGGHLDERPALIRAGLETAELIKYASNAFLAMKISFANELANICELVGADVLDVTNAVGLDERIGTRFLDAGAGWGGSCFGKDLGELIAAAADHGYDARLLAATRDVNGAQRERVVKKLQSRLHGLRGRRICMLGLAFKPGTDDLRDAPSVDIARRLTEGGASVSAHDPVVRSAAQFEGVRLADDPYGAADRADAVLLLTDWPEYQELDFVRLRDRMRGSLLLDGRNCLDPFAVEAAGLTYEGIGRTLSAGPSDDWSANELPQRRVGVR